MNFLLFSDKKETWVAKEPRIQHVRTRLNLILNAFIFVWRGKLKKETLDQIENLRKHIRKGCLSDIPFGCGTEINERLKKEHQSISTVRSIKN